jgi:hypothetical protein
MPIAQRCHLPAAARTAAFGGASPLREGIAMNSTLDPDNEPIGPDEDNERRGRDGRALGPSDSSDSGSDTVGARRHAFDVDSPLDQHALERGDAALDSDTDRAGTGERASADGDAGLDEDADIEPDHTERLSEPGNTDDPDAGSV